MKKMQKWIALLLAVLMLSAIFAGCAKPTTTPEQGDTQQTETDTQGTETANQPAPQPQEGSDAAWDTSKNDEIIVTVINGYYTAGERSSPRNTPSCTRKPRSRSTLFLTTTLTWPRCSPCSPAT